MQAAVPNLVLSLGVLVALTVVNVRTHRLPDRLTLPGAVTSVVVAAGASYATGDFGALWGGLAGGAAMTALLFATLVVNPSGSVGLGTVKAVPLVGVPAGVMGVYAWVCALVLPALAMWLVRFAMDRRGVLRTLPTGPFLLAGLLGAVLGRLVWDAGLVGP